MAHELYAGRHVKLMAEGKWEYAERTRATGGVIILAFTAQDELLLVEQFRPPVGKRVISLPAGLTGDQDGLEKAAASASRELEEETGHRAERQIELTTGPSSPGMITEIMTFFRAEGVTKIANAKIDEEEGITLHAVPRAELMAWLRAREAEGMLIDFKIYAALYLAERKELA